MNLATKQKDGIAKLPEMKITGVMHFDNYPHLIYTLGNTDYISMRQLVDQIGLDWRTQKKGLLLYEALIFYKTLTINEGNIFTNSIVGDEIKTVETAFCYPEFIKKDTVFCALNRVQMYIARICVGHVRGKGNVISAKYLLEIYEKFGEALYKSERTVTSIKSRLS